MGGRAEGPGKAADRPGEEALQAGPEFVFPGGNRLRGVTEQSSEWNTPSSDRVTRT